MSHFLDRLTHFSQPKASFSGGHSVTVGEDRTWEEAYRSRWQHYKIEPRGCGRGASYSWCLHKPRRLK